jgi:methylmalonyl-CoA mutase cobalamin-binding domain/chain
MKKYRILIAKPGLDGHDRGAKVVAHALRDAGLWNIVLFLLLLPDREGRQHRLVAERGLAMGGTDG